MRSVDIMRSELDRLDLSSRLSPELRRLLTKQAKDARKRGDSPRIAVSRALTKLLNPSESTR
jgi:hypothetical protein